MTRARITWRSKCMRSAISRSIVGGQQPYCDSAAMVVHFAALHCLPKSNKRPDTQPLQRVSMSSYGYRTMPKSLRALIFISMSSVLNLCLRPASSLIPPTSNLFTPRHTRPANEQSPGVAAARNPLTNPLSTLCRPVYLALYVPTISSHAIVTRDRDAPCSSPFDFQRSNTK